MGDRWRFLYPVAWRGGDAGAEHEPGTERPVQAQEADGRQIPRQEPEA